MGRLVLRRLVEATLTLLGMSVVIFALVRLSGDPLQVVLPLEATPEMQQQARVELGLDKSLVGQYLQFLGNALQGDFGTSFRSHTPVSDVIGERLVATLQLGGTAVLITLVVAVPLGAIAGYRRGGWLDLVARSFAVLGQAAPPYWVGMLLIMLFGVRLGLLPVGGADHGLASLVLPAGTLAIFLTAGISRLMRSSIIEELHREHILFERALGLSERSILWKHALRNAALPVLTYGGVVVASLLAGSVVTEAVFSWPGMGQLLLQSVTTRDFPTVQALVLVLAAVYIGVNLLVDILYAAVNPRLRTA